VGKVNLQKFPGAFLCWWCNQLGVGCSGRGRKWIGRNPINLIVRWCGRFLFFVVPQQFLRVAPGQWKSDQQFSQDIGEWLENQILIPDWTYFHCPGATLENGITKLIKRAFANEHLFLTKTEGEGNLFLADWGKAIKVGQPALISRFFFFPHFCFGSTKIVKLEGDSLVLNGSNFLAFEPSLHWDIGVMKGPAGWIEGGLFNVTFKGNGFVALTTYFEPITLPVSRGHPVYTSPHATVAWSGNLKPSVHLDVQLKSLLGYGSGESVQMQFEGDSGFVVVQPFEFVVK